MPALIWGSLILALQNEWTQIAPHAIACDLQRNVAQIACGVNQVSLMCMYGSVHPCEEQSSGYTGVLYRWAAARISKHIPVYTSHRVQCMDQNTERLHLPLPAEGQLHFFFWHYTHALAVFCCKASSCKQALNLLKMSLEIRQNLNLQWNSTFPPILRCRG